MGGHPRFKEIVKFLQPRFLEIVEEMTQIHDAKNADYAGDDPLSNLKLCEAFGVEPWRGVLVRMSDKWSRITQLSTREAKVKSEKIPDTLTDMSVYSILCRILWEESHGAVDLLEVLEIEPSES